MSYLCCLLVVLRSFLIQVFLSRVILTFFDIGMLHLPVFYLRVAQSHFYQHVLFVICMCLLFSFDFILRFLCLHFDAFQSYGLSYVFYTCVLPKRSCIDGFNNIFDDFYYLLVLRMFVRKWFSHFSVWKNCCYLVLGICFFYVRFYLCFSFYEVFYCCVLLLRLPRFALRTLLRGRFTVFTYALYLHCLLMFFLKTTAFFSLSSHLCFSCVFISVFNYVCSLCTHSRVYKRVSFHCSFTCLRVYPCEHLVCLCLLFLTYPLSRMITYILVFF